MKKNERIRVGRVIIALIILLLVIVSIVFLIDSFKKDEVIENPNINNPDDLEDEHEGVIPSETKTNYLGEVTGEEIDSEVLGQITNLLNLYYRSMAKLEIIDMTSLFSNESSDSALIYQTTIDLLVTLRSMKHVDLSLYDGYYNIEIKDIEISGNDLTVEVIEDSYINFSFMKEITTEVLNVSNSFSFTKVNGEYKLVSYSKGQDFYVLVTDKYNNGGKTELDKIKSDYILQTEELVRNWEVDHQYVVDNGVTSNKSCTYDYDRDKALEYANNYVGIRNDDWWTFSANCQNYASQVLIAGGIAMDYTGDANKQLQWKFYDGSYNLSEEAKGYNYTWTYVPYFYTYAKDNTGVGLCATVDENIYFAEAGDVIQMGTKWYDRHTVVSLGFYEKDGIKYDILLNSNSVDLKNFPLSAYTYPYQRLIKVHGYN